MKKIILLLSFLGLFISCQEDKVIFDDVNGGTMFSFARATGSITLDVNNPNEVFYEIPVNVTTKSSVDRSFVVVPNHTVSDPLASYYEIVSSSLIIKAGDYNGFIKIKCLPKQFAAFDKKYLVKLTLSSVDNGVISKNNYTHEFSLEAKESKLSYSSGSSTAVFDSAIPASLTKEISVKVTTSASYDRTFVIEPDHLATDPIASYYSINQTSLLIKAGETTGKIVVNANVDNIPTVATKYIVNFKLSSFQYGVIASTQFSHKLTFEKK